MSWQSKIRLFDIQPEWYFQSLSKEQHENLIGFLDKTFSANFKDYKNKSVNKSGYLLNHLSKELIKEKTKQILASYAKLSLNPAISASTKSMYSGFIKDLSSIINKQINSEYSLEDIEPMVTGKSRFEVDYPELKFMFSDAMILGTNTIDKYWASPNQSYIFKDKSVSDIFEVIASAVEHFGKMIEGISKGDIPEALNNFLIALSKGVNGPLDSFFGSVRNSLESLLGIHDDINASPGLKVVSDLLWEIIIKPNISSKLFTMFTSLVDQRGTVGKIARKFLSFMFDNDINDHKTQLSRTFIGNNAGNNKDMGLGRRFIDSSLKSLSEIVFDPKSYFGDTKKPKDAGSIIDTYVKAGNYLVKECIDSFTDPTEKTEKASDVRSVVDPLADFNIETGTTSKDYMKDVFYYNAGLGTSEGSQLLDEDFAPTAFTYLNMGSFVADPDPYSHFNCKILYKGDWKKGDIHNAIP